MCLYKKRLFVNYHNDNDYYHDYSLFQGSNKTAIKLPKHTQQKLKKKMFCFVFAYVMSVILFTSWRPVFKSSGENS